MMRKGPSCEDRSLPSRRYVSNHAIGEGGIDLRNRVHRMVAVRAAHEHVEGHLLPAQLLAQRRADTIKNFAGRNAIVSGASTLFIAPFSSTDPMTSLPTFTTT